MFMQGMFMLFLSLGLGYALCVMAEKQKRLLRTVGYTLGIAILVLSLIYGLIGAEGKWCKFGKKGMMHGPMAKPYHMMKR